MSVPPRSFAPACSSCWAPVVRPPVGWIAQNDGRVALGAAVPLGVLQATVAEYLAVIDAPMVITPWRSIIVFDLDEGVADAALRVLAPQGLVFDENSPWLSVSACTGSPGCAHSLADVRADAAEVAAATSDPAEKKSLAEKMQAVAYDLVPFVPLGQAALAQGVASDLEGFIDSPVPFFWNVSRKQ